jgi:hypothetical protein
MKEAIPMSTENHSLEPDMIFGWKPDNIEHGAPIPLDFDMEYLPARTNSATSKQAPVLFHG